MFSCKTNKIEKLTSDIICHMRESVGLVLRENRSLKIVCTIKLHYTKYRVCLKVFKFFILRIKVVLQNFT